MAEDKQLQDIINSRVNRERFQKEHWEGSFWEYLDLVNERPQVIRSAFQRAYDMVMSYGTEAYKAFKREVIRYQFFSDPMDGGQDAIFGLDRHLMHFVDILRSAAEGYGTDKRIILLHGPVGSSKSTIARLLKKGLERYSRTDEGALYSYTWMLDENASGEGEPTVAFPCPMNEEPLLLIPAEARVEVLRKLNEKYHEQGGTGTLALQSDLNPFSRKVFNELMLKYDGDWKQVMEHVRVRRVIISEKDRVGIGTFQPKDEKNQDSTELTGDINYRKIAQFGSDSDPRAFNFDGEFNVANRGIIEFIEVLKLDVAFL